MVITIAKVCNEEGALLHWGCPTTSVSAVGDRVRGSGTSVQLVFLHEESLGPDLPLPSCCTYVYFRQGDTGYLTSWVDCTNKTPPRLDN